MAGDKAVGRVTRLLGLVEYLELHGPTSFADLGAHFGVSAAQIKDDLYLLWVSGRPGYSHEDLVDFDASAFEAGVADLTEAQGLRQVRYSAREAAALVGALSALDATGAAPAATRTVVEKLTAALGGSSVEIVDSATVAPEVRGAIDEAISARSTLELTYVDAQERQSVRTVEPHRLVVIDGAGYLECFCHRAQDYRMLRLERIVSVQPGGGHGTHEPADRLGFTVDQGWVGTVTLARAGQWAVEELPGVELHTSGEVVTARFHVANADWIAGRLLAVAPHLRSVGPAALHDAVVRRAQAVIDAHSV